MASSSIDTENHCPNCQFKKEPDAEECPKCGIIFAKIKKRDNEVNEAQQTENPPEPQRLVISEDNSSKQQFRGKKIFSQKNKKIFIITTSALSVIFICVVLLKFIFSYNDGLLKDSPKIGDEIMSKALVGNYAEAKRLIYENFKDDKNTALKFLVIVRELEGKTYRLKLQIQDGWEWDNDYSSNYNYIRGRILNTGDKIVSYFKVTAHYMDDDKNVIDTDFTNSGETLRPDMAKEFEIMHHDSSQYKYVRVFVEDIRLN